MTKRSTAKSTSETATRTVNLRVREDIRDLIDRAAQSQGKSRSEFMIDAARRAAEDGQLDQTLVRVDAETYAHFLNVLDQPAGGDENDRQMKQSAEFSVSPIQRPWKNRQHTRHRKPCFARRSCFKQSGKRAELISRHRLIRLWTMSTLIEPVEFGYGDWGCVFLMGNCDPGPFDPVL